MIIFIKTTLLNKFKKLQNIGNLQTLQMKIKNGKKRKKGILYQFLFINNLIIIINRTKVLYTEMTFIKLTYFLLILTLI
jgi:hypothetical protein